MREDHCIREEDRDEIRHFANLLAVLYVCGTHPLLKKRFLVAMRQRLIATFEKTSGCVDKFEDEATHP